MTYNSKEELPEYMRKSMPDEAQQIYLEAYNKSWENFDQDETLGQQSQEAQAHRDGWNAVKQEYVHDEDKGIWYRKGEEPEDFGDDEDEGLLDKIT